MALKKSVSTADAALLIKVQLDAWCAKRSGTTKILEGIQHLWEEISIVQDKPRLLICCTGEESRGDAGIRGHLQRVDRQWEVVIIRGHGFKNLVAEGEGDAMPFHTAWEQVRDEVRKILNIGEEFPAIEYLGSSPVPNLAPNQQANVFLSAQSLRFSTANDIPRLTTTVPNQQPG